MPTGIQIAPTLDYVGAPRASKDRYDEACAQAAREAIRDWLDAKGITQERAGQLLEVNQGTVSKWRRPEGSERPPPQPSLKTLIAFRRASGVSIDAALGLDKEAAAHQEKTALAIEALQERVNRLEGQPQPVTRKVRKGER